MTMLIVAITLVYLVLILTELVLTLLFSTRFKNVSQQPNEWPHVSVLICARNEELNLDRCLESLIRQDYPREHMQLLIGNDNSEDGTAEKIAGYTSSYSFIKEIEITHEKDGLIAKANVLNQLIDATDDEYIVILDADMKARPGWLRSMVSALGHSPLVSGYTRIDPHSFRAQIQAFDWQIVLHSMKAMADTFRPISILGNNMGFRRSAYDQVGGFRALGPTDVEDLGLLQRFQKAGLSTLQLIDGQGSAYTLPQATWTEIIVQRCRWMNGVFTHHWLLAIPAFFARLWLPVALLMFFFHPEVALFIVLYAYGASLVKYIQVSHRSAGAFKLLLGEPFFISLLDTFALLRILIFGKVSWKGRKF